MQRGSSNWSPMARPRKRSRRARIVLASGRGAGTNAIMREARVSKPTVWRWQSAYMDGGVERLLRDDDKGERAGKRPISDEVRLAIVTSCSPTERFWLVKTPDI
jgi:transposase